MRLYGLLGIFAIVVMLSLSSVQAIDSSSPQKNPSKFLSANAQPSERNPSPNEEVSISKKKSSGGALLTKLDSNGKKMDLITPYGQIIRCEDTNLCVAWDPVNRKVLQEFPASFNNPNREVLNIGWYRPDMKHLW